MSGYHSRPHTDIGTVENLNNIVPLFAPVTSKVHAVGYRYIIADYHLIHAQIIKITFHSDEAAFANLKTAQAIETNSYRSQYAVGSNVLTYTFADKMPKFANN